jgi:hypothetical protein
MTSRAELLERLLVALTRGDEPVVLGERTLHEPTVALLDAWATVGVVLGFYADRIADEGYLATALEPGSILALARLVGHRPQPGVAARTYLAYSLNADPDDKAVLLPGALLSQTVPGPGEQPQTFETTDRLVARPSWNRLVPRRSQPLATPLRTLQVAGANTGLAPNDAILVQLGSQAGPAVVRVARVQVDLTANRTTVALQDSDTPSLPPVPSPPDVTTAIDSLLTGGLARAPAPVPDQPPQDVKASFAPGSDAVPRLLSALHPAVGATLYRALDRTALGAAEVLGASALQVKAAPFGAQAPPIPRFDADGRPAGSEDWPIGDTHTLTFSSTVSDIRTALRTSDELERLFERVLAAFEVVDEPALDVRCDVGSLSASAAIDLFGDHTARLGALGQVTLRTEGWTAELRYQGTERARVAGFALRTTREEQGDLVTLSIDRDEYLWDPRIRTPVHVALGERRLSIVWSTPTRTEASVNIVIETPLALEHRDVLELDGVYDGIVPHSPVLIERDEPLLARVERVRTVTVSRYGVTARATQLTLDKPWISAAERSQKVLREITVRAQPAALALQGLPNDDDVGGSAIELDGLVAGMEPGRLLIVRGLRTDLAGGAAVPSGEVSMVSALSNGGGDGEPARTTLHLAAPLAYRYAHDSVELFGNVVAAHQGATTNEVLGSGGGQPSFTLTGAPLLASSLTVTVDGVGYAEVERADDATSARSFLTRTDAHGHTVVSFASPLPVGDGNVRASYRAGDGGQGNAHADQVTQLLSRPGGVAAVTNPLPASGGSAGDGAEDVRGAAPRGLRGLGRVVSLSDYADLASTHPAVAKAVAERTADGVSVTVAGRDPVPLDAALCDAIAAELAAAGDPAFPAVVVAARLFVIVIEASVVRDPLVSWDETATAASGALLDAFGYPRRALGQDVALSDLIAAAHRAASVLSFTVTTLALIPSSVGAGDLATTLPGLLGRPVPQVLRLAEAAAAWGIPASRAVAYLTDAAPATLSLREHAS